MPDSHTPGKPESRSPPWGFQPTADSSTVTRAATVSYLPSSYLSGTVCLGHRSLGLLSALRTKQTSELALNPEPPADACTLMLQHPCEEEPSWVSPRLKRPGVPEQFADLIV